MPLNTQVALDSRLVIDDPTLIIVQGASQNLPRQIPATSVNNGQISWNNILSIGTNVLIDPSWFVQYDVAITWDTTTGLIPPGIQVNTNVATLAPLYSGNLTQVAIPNLCFAQNPLSRVSNSISLQFNNVETTTSASIVQTLCREYIVDNNLRNDLASSCPSALYVAPGTIDQTANQIVPNQPNTPYAYAGGKSNASFAPKSVVLVTGTTYTATYSLAEPVFISPCSVQGGPGFGQVQSINLRYNLDASTGLQGMLNTSDYASIFTQAQLSCKITAADLYLDYLTVDTSMTGAIPPVVYYNFEFPEFQQTLATGINDNFATAQSLQQTTQSYKLSTMPKAYYCKVSPQVQGITAGNNMCGLAIVRMTITFGSFGLFSFDREQLWQCFKKNTGFLNMSFSQWVALGTPVYLNPAVDISSANGAFQGKTGDSGIMWQNQITYSNENYLNAGNGLTTFSSLGIAVAGGIYIYEGFMNSGSCQIGEGTCIFKNTTVNENEYIRALDNDAISADALKTSQGVSGGSFFSSLKGIVHGAHKALKTGAQFLQNPIVQSGLGALAGSGMSAGQMSAGSMSHSLRRRK